MFPTQNEGHNFLLFPRKTNPDIPLDYFFGGPLFSDSDIPIETPLHGIWLILTGLFPAKDLRLLRVPSLALVKQLVPEMQRCKRYE